MAVKKFVTRRALSVIAPLAVGGVKWLYEHPEIWDQIKEQLGRLAKHQGNTPEDLHETIGILREQVSYLVESADDAEESRRAQAWAKRLEDFERTVALVTAPGTPAKERKALTKKVHALRSEIVKSYLAEVREDAEEGTSPTA